MFNVSRLKSGTATFLAFGLTTSAIAPFVVPAPAYTQTTNFVDVSSNYWAKDFIAELSERGIIAGFTDGTFQPDSPVTRAQFAAMVSKAFDMPQVRNSINFADVPSGYWAAPAINEAYSTGFMSGYPNQIFKAEQNIPREQVLVALANGLDYTTNASTSTVLSYYNDTSNISNFAREPIAAATDNRLVVNYPNLKSLNPTRNATRAEVAALIYQALVNEGQAQTIASQYIVERDSTPTPVVRDFTIPDGTTIPVKYEKEKILVTKEETAPLTLTIAANISAQDGTVLIPFGSEVVGELQPADNGSQFVANQLVMANGETKSLNARSEVITQTEVIRRGASVGDIAKNAAIGAAAAAAISAVTGDKAIATEEVLGGVGVGALLGLFLGRDRVELVTIDPDTDLNLTLGSSLVISKR